MLVCVAADTEIDRPLRLGFAAAAPAGELDPAESSGDRHVKYQAAKLCEAINPRRARSADLDRVEELLREAGAIRNPIIGSCLRLVISIVKKCTEPGQDFVDLVSEGNVSLIQASERFDFARGIRFSTYATWVIINGLARGIPRERSRRGRFATGREGLLQALADHRGSDCSDATDQEQSREVIRKLLGRLDDREQTIIVRRFGLAGDKQTLVEVGRELGISKERVRQVESRALDKLRALAEVQILCGAIVGSDRCPGHLELPGRQDE